MADDYMSDKFVAGLIKEEARQASKDYAMYGMSAYLPKRPTTEAPKPNKRFLRTILRDTDSHNQALLAKEAEESQARLRALRREEERRTWRNHGGHRSRRHEEDEAEDRHHSKRRRLDVQARDRNRLSPPKDFAPLSPRENQSSDRREEKDQRQRKRRNSSEDLKEYNRRHADRGYDRRRERPSKRSHHRDRRRSSSSHRRHLESEDEDRIDYRLSRRRHRGNDEESSEDEPRQRERDKHRKRRHSREYSDGSLEHYAPKTHRSHRDRDQRRRSRSPLRERRRDDSRRRRRSQSAEDRSSKASVRDIGSRSIIKPTNKVYGRDAPNDDSDPLEELVGPLPPPSPPKVKVRGRGAASSMAMDTRFKSGYDPVVDITLDAMEDDEWGQKKEALQAQAKFKQNQAERLLAAGFTEAEIKLWTKGGEKDEDDVQWAKRGEGREWDRGKVVDEDSGIIDTEPSWGRLKGT